MRGCIKTKSLTFDDEINYKPNMDYNHFARMTTFNGQAVIVGIVADDYRTENGKRVAKKANKYLEVFNKVENKWRLKSPEDESNLLSWITQFALVPLKDNLLHLGGDDIASDDTSSSYNSDYKYLSFSLDAVYQKWTKMDMG